MWTKHILGPAKLPQKCVRCGVTLIELRINPDTKAQMADPLDREGEAVYHNPDENGHVTTKIPDGIPFTECAKS